MSRLRFSSCKRFLRFLALGLFCLVFGSHICLFTLGSLAKLYVKFCYETTLSFTDIRFSSEGIEIKDLQLKNEQNFDCFSQDVSISFRKKKLQFQTPIIQVFSLPEISLSDKDSAFSSSWNIAIVDGICHFKDIKDISLSFSYNPNHDFLWASFSAKKGHLFLESKASERGKTLEVSFENFPLTFLQDFSQSNLDGFLSGNLYFRKSEGRWSGLKGTIHAENCFVENYCESVSGHFDWDGEVFLEGRDALISSLKSISSLRMKIDEGSFIRSSDFLCRNASCNLSYFADSGAKWDGSFQHDSIPFHFSGRGFLQSIQGSWVESDFFSSQSKISLQCREKSEGFLCNLQAKLQGDDLVEFSSKIADLLWGESLCLRPQIGACQFALGAVWDANEWKNIRIDEAFVQDISIVHKDDIFFCKEFRAENNQFVFNGADFRIGELFEGNSWSGHGNLHTLAGSISGYIGDFFIRSELFGSHNVITADISFDGPFNGGFSLVTQVDGTQFHCDIRKGHVSYETRRFFEDIACQVDFSKNGFSLYQFNAFLDLDRKIQVYCPIFESSGIFDVRFREKTFDFARLKGSHDQGSFSLDLSKSHCLGSNFGKADVHISKNGLDACEVECKFPIQALLFYLQKIPDFLQSNADRICSVRFAKTETTKPSFEFISELQLQEHLIPVFAKFIKNDGLWSIDSLIDKKIQFIADLISTQGSVEIHRGKVLYADAIEASLEGWFSDFQHWSMKMDRFHVDLSKISFAQDHAISGFLCGDGIIHFDQAFQMDFDVQPTKFSYQNLELENLSPLHVYYNFESGILARGIYLKVVSSDPVLSSCMCKAGLLACDFNSKTFQISDAHLNLPHQCMSYFPVKQDYFSYFPTTGIQGKMDVEACLDFSYVKISLDQLAIPLDDLVYKCSDIEFLKKSQQMEVHANIDFPDQVISVASEFSLDPCLYGKVVFDNDLTLRWSNKERFIVESLKGRGLGLDANFQYVDGCLVGNSRVDGNIFRRFLPPKIAKVFHELKIGSGFELKGKLNVQGLGLTFGGVLTGKQFQLFGFEMKNFLSQISWSPEHFELLDVKISDFAGVLQVDQVLAKGSDNIPWTISIPSITATEIRPSLLQDVGGPPGKLSPLVVRKLCLRDFKGRVDDSSTYTAEGELFFINSYKRDKSILELPSDLLSRIVGLDFELLIPVCGTLRYQLHDGFFHFTDLLGSFSENQRSEFFLVFNQDSPKMDLDWNLHILIQMKQFVLFKFTEAFMISVTGKLDDPKFQLQRKKRFLGVL